MGRSKAVSVLVCLWLVITQFVVRVCKSSVSMGPCPTLLHRVFSSHRGDERREYLGLLIRGDETAQRSTLKASNASTNELYASRHMRTVRFSAVQCSAA